MDKELEYKAKKYEQALEYLKEQVKVCEDEMRISTTLSSEDAVLNPFRIAGEIIIKKPNRVSFIYNIVFLYYLIDNSLQICYNIIERTRRI